MAKRGLGPLLAVLALGAFVLSACGDDYVASEQVSIGGERFSKLRFEDLPHDSRAEVKEAASTIDGIETEVRTVMDTNPELVLRYWETSLADRGWEVVEEPFQYNDAGSWEGIWQRWGRQLVVTSSLQDPDAEGKTPTDYTLAMSS